jgi:very-short-patch-repair endonuclease
MHSKLWRAARCQHAVVTRAQLLELGFSPAAIRHRLATGRLHRVFQGVYAVGRPDLTQHGRWMAAVLASGPEAVLSHASAAALWELRAMKGRGIEVSVPSHRVPRSRPGIRVHRRADLGTAATKEGIPLTSPLLTLVDLAARLDRKQLEAAINEADKRDLIDPETLRACLVGAVPRPGVRALKEVLDRATFTLTDSELERRFLSIARTAGLSQPQTQVWVGGFRVDFFWPDLGLVVETDGLRYHRTPAEQAKDRLRDQAHTAAGRTPLRFTHRQVAYDQAYVAQTLKAVAGRLRGSSIR